MQIIYCDTCGMRIPEADLQSGAALREDSQRAFCVQCSLTQKGTKLLARPPTRENAVLARPAKPATGATQRPAVSRSGSAPASARNSNKLWIALGLGASAIGLALILFAARGKPVSNIETPAPPPAPAAGLGNVSAPNTARLGDKPQTAPPDTVALTRPPPAEKKPEAGIDDIRESFAKRKWAEIKAEAETSGAKGMIRTKVRNFSSTYATTAAGKEAAEFLKSMSANDPPPPGANVFAIYTRDFKNAVPAPGWRYLWNQNGPIGDESKYAPLVWNESRDQYSGDPKNYPGGPSAWARLSKSGCHPGQGTDQGVTADRFAIAAYTLQAGQSGKCALVGRINRLAGGGTIELRIYVNDTLKGSMTFDGSAALIESPLELGMLAAGDDVYVCIGPNKGDGSDSSSLDFTIYPIP